MKTKSTCVLIAIAISFASSCAQAQLIFNFVTTIGSGSLTLNPANLVSFGGDISAARYRSTLDSLTFNGINHSNLIFTVYNTSMYADYRDGFGILVDRIGPSERLNIKVYGNPAVVDGVSVTDLMTVLDSFTSLQQVGTFYTEIINYNDANNPLDTQYGRVSSFQSVPEPSAIVLFGIGMPWLLARQRHNKCLSQALLRGSDQ